MGGSICRLSALLRAFLKENSLIEWPGSLTSWLASSFVLQQAVCLFDVFEIDTSAIKSLMLGADITIKNVVVRHLHYSANCPQVHVSNVVSQLTESEVLDPYLGKLLKNTVS